MSRPKNNTAKESNDAVETPLHTALEHYAKLFGLDILDWVAWFGWVRKIGIVLLIAGSVATFAVDALKGAGFGESFPLQLMRFAQALVPLLPGVTTLFLTGIS